MRKKKINSLIERHQFQAQRESQLPNRAKTPCGFSPHPYAVPTLTSSLCKANRAEQRIMSRHSQDTGGNDISKTQGEKMWTEIQFFFFF